MGSHAPAAHLAVDPAAHLEGPAPQSAVKARGHRNVSEGRAATGAKGDPAGDPAVEPVVLVLDPGPRRPPHHHDRQFVHLVADQLGHVELRGESTVGGDSNECSVQPDRGRALSSAEVEDDSVAAPMPSPAEVGRCDATSVEASRIVFGHRRRIPGKRHHHVRVLGKVAGVLHGPVARNLDRSPARRLRRATHGPAGGSLEGGVEKAEPPVRVEVAPSSAHTRTCLIEAAVAAGRRPRGKPVESGQGGVLPPTADHRRQCSMLVNLSGLGHLVTPVRAIAAEPRATRGRSR